MPITLLISLQQRPNNSSLVSPILKDMASSLAIADVKLKLLVDSKSKRVLFGEAVDKNSTLFLFHILNLPLVEKGLLTSMVIMDDMSVKPMSPISTLEISIR
ncbi:hypothetical protein Csa_000233 [Cucumis sativus]|uniref:Uncharacterized protein n=1 Tax=Cucumis sativus TaxID=3659 RepID=A0A0A0KNU3_CUCSA|nr:hypothetical protein Csa_000233 [Cucumis sativus]